MSSIDAFAYFQRVCLCVFFNEKQQTKKIFIDKSLQSSNNKTEKLEQEVELGMSTFLRLLLFYLIIYSENFTNI